MGRERDGEDMVRADQIPALVPRAAGRSDAGDDAQPDLRRSRLLTGLRAKARELGFDACRIAAPSLPAAARDNLAAWLADDAHGDMDWMAETFARRADPNTLWPEARSVIMLAVNYGPASDPLTALSERSRGAVSVYARHRDYHDVVKGKLKMLAGWLVAAARPEQVDLKVFVDTAPVMEKPLAAAAGVGWQGKHTNLVSREFGSWLFLGAIFTDLAFPPDAAERDHCGSCRACLDACPTQAFDGPYRLDARRCVSYLTIEHKGPIPPALRPGIGNRIYGCDDCLAVCPWNKFAREGREAKLTEPDGYASPPLAELAALDDEGFRRRFAGGPIKRIGHARFLRNVLIAIGNSGDAALAPAALARLAQPSPLVRAMAVWALSRLLAPEAFRTLAQRCAGEETDAEVLEEWLRPPSR
ncbi:MAG: tRNA epoxyqueuosine(34) reductase QueG [Hyphomicrobiales bacterium]|nr:tRNA epoxyqueuosine(34) reductase QueG [Hyphomicrobiales bacterium]